MQRSRDLRRRRRRRRRDGCEIPENRTPREAVQRERKREKLFGIPGILKVD